MRRAGQAAGLLRGTGPALLTALVLVEAAVAVLPLAVIGTIGVVVGRVAGRGAIAGPVVVLSLLLLLQQAVTPLRAALTYLVTRRVDGRVRTRVMELANGSLGIGPFENPTTLDRMELAGGLTDPFWGATPGGAAVGVVSLGGRYLQVAGAALLVARLSVPAAVGLTTVVLLAYHRSRRWNRIRLRVVRENHRAGRASRYMSGLANTPPPAKEVRLFGAIDWLEDRFRRMWDELVAARLTPYRWAARRTTLLVAALTPAVALAFVALARAGATGGAGPRRLSVALQGAVALFTLLFDQRQDDAYQVDFGLEALDTLAALEATVGRSDAGVALGTRDGGGLPAEAIRFHAVRFAYPGTEREVFAGLDLPIAAGTSLAIVGGNGAGKTTLVKLLARLHDPQAGGISVDGIPLPELDPGAWRRQLAVILQDFVRYELPAADNVGFGGLGRHADRDALRRAASRAGALDVVERLPAGWDTPLHRQYRGGADLSGGEWQRVALARALFAVEAGARVLVLDEPTANLDVRAEAALFDDFLDLTRA